MLARVTRINTPSGSSSGMGTCTSSKGLPGPKKTAAVAMLAMSGTSLRAELERVVEGAHRQLGVLVLDDAGDGDLGGGDHLDVHALLRERVEHASGHPGLAAHAHAPDRDLGHAIVGCHPRRPDLPRRV